MINLRYHIISLVAVFLALAVGILMGATVLDRSTVALLEGSSAALRSSLDSHRAENERLAAELGQWQAFGEGLREGLLRGQLAGRHVMLVDTDDVDGGTRDAVVDAVTEAGATYAGRVTIALERAELVDGDARAELGEALEVTDDDPAVLQRALIEGLSTRLLHPSVLPADDDRAADPLTELRDLGFLADLDIPAGVDTAEPYPPAGSLFVVAGPTSEPEEGEEPQLLPETVLVPLAGQLAVESPQPVVAVEDWEPPGAVSWLAALRGDDRVANRIGSVDNVDQVPGQVALVVALRDQTLGEPPGHYGTGEGAQSLLPDSAVDTLLPDQPAESLPPGVPPELLDPAAEATPSPGGTPAPEATPDPTSSQPATPEGTAE